MMLELVTSSKLIKVNDVLITQEIRYLSQIKHRLAPCYKGKPLGLYFQFGVKYFKEKITALYFERSKLNFNQI